MPVITPLGAETRVNTSTQDVNFYSAITALRDGSGRYVIAYERTGETTNLLFGRVYEADGTPVGAEFAIGAAFARRIEPSITALSNGEFVIGFYEFTGTGLAGFYVSRYAADATLIRTVRIDDPASTSERSFTVRPNGDYGGYIVTWNTDEVYARIADGADALSAPILLSSPDLSSDNQLLANTAELTGGGFVTTWGSTPIPNPGGTYGASAQFRLFDAAGAPIGATVTLVDGPNVYVPQVAALTDGRFVVTYGALPLSTADPSPRWMAARIFTADGQPAGPPVQFQSSSGDLGVTGILALPGGGFVVAYQEAGTIALQVFGSNGQPIGAEAIAATGNAQMLGDLQLALLDNGTIVLTWDALTANDADSEVFMRRFMLDLGNADPVAQDDNVVTDENSPVSGLLTANDTAAGAVTAIDGNAASVGMQLTLASGALLTVNADGSYSYDPNGVYQNLSAEGAYSTAYEAFTYTTADGGTADVLITITGILVPGEPYIGTAGNDTIGGDGSYTFYDFQQGGNDRVLGGDADEGFFFGAAFTGNDVVNGGGGNDQLSLQGSISLFLDSSNITNVETLALLSYLDTRFASDSTPNNYNIVANSLTVASGANLVVDGSGLQADESFAFNGQNETNGSFVFLGGFGTDTLTGGSQSDRFFFDNGRFAATDRVNGRTGAEDRLELRGDYSAGIVFTATTVTNIETITLISSMDPNYASSATPFSYALTSNDSNVAAGATLLVNGAGLIAGEVLSFNGSAELNGRFDLRGGAAGDTLTGGQGDDMLDGGAGVDTMTGGLGNDIYVVDNAGDVVVENAGEGTADEIRTTLATYALSANVEILTYTGSGTPALRGNAADNMIAGGGQADFIDLRDGGADSATGGGGDDGIYFGAAYTGGDSVDGGAGTLDQIGLQGDYSGGVTLGSLAGVELVVLLPGNDSRFGGQTGTNLSYNITAADASVAAGQTLVVQANILRAGEALTFNGSAESDGAFLIYGGLGADNLTGGAANDGFFFGQGRFGVSDIVNGGAGTMDQLGLQGNFTITFGAAQLSGIEFVVLLSASDGRFGLSGGTVSYDLTTHDANVAAGQQLVVSANTLTANETLTFRGSFESNGSFRIFSGGGDDFLAGSQTADVIFGSGGDDFIEGQGGADQLTGGAGDDSFHYFQASHSTNAAPDQILDFATGDLIDLTGLVSNTGGGDFSFIGGSAQNGARQVQVNQNGNVATVNVFIDGDATADLVIGVTVADGHMLVASDFDGVTAGMLAEVVKSGALELFVKETAEAEEIHLSILAGTGAVGGLVEVEAPLMDSLGVYARSGLFESYAIDPVSLPDPVNIGPGSDFGWIGMTHDLL